MPYFWYMVMRDRRKSVSIYHLLFGQAWHGKKYKGLIGNGGKLLPSVRKVQRGLYEISEEQRKMVEAELKRLDVIHGFLDEKKGLIPW